jgi:hypothetical protein
VAIDSITGFPNPQGALTMGTFHNTSHSVKYVIYVFANQLPNGARRVSTL